MKGRVIFSPNFSCIDYYKCTIKVLGITRTLIYHCLGEYYLKVYAGKVSVGVACRQAPAQGTSHHICFSSAVKAGRAGPEKSAGLLFLDVPV